MKRRRRRPRVGRHRWAAFSGTGFTTPSTGDAQVTRVFDVASGADLPYTVGSDGSVTITGINRNRFPENSIVGVTLDRSVLPADIARGRTATASSDETSKGNTAAKAVDGSLSFRENGDGCFLTGNDMRWFYGQYAPLELRSEPALDLLGTAVLHGLPPAVVATAEFDPLRDEGDAYANRLRSAGVRVEHIPGPGLIHGYFAFLGVVSAADQRSREVLRSLDTLLP